MVFLWLLKFWWQWSTMVWRLTMVCNFSARQWILGTTGTGKWTLLQKSIIKIENGCDHKKVSFFLETTVNFIDLRRQLTSSMVFRKALNVSMVLKRPLEIFNGFWGDYHHWMFFWQSGHCHHGFSMVFGLTTIAFNGFRWFWTVGQTMRWFRWIVMVYANQR